MQRKTAFGRVETAIGIPLMKREKEAAEQIAANSAATGGEVFQNAWMQDMKETERAMGKLTHKAVNAFGKLLGYDYKTEALYDSKALVDAEMERVERGSVGSRYFA